MIRCSIIIPSYDAADLTLACVRRLKESPPGVPHEIIVVDNHSPDGTYGRLRAEFPDLKSFQNSSNLGFSKACNRGAREAQGLYLAFLNCDAQILPGALERLCEWLAQHPQSGIVGPKLLGPDGRLIQMSWGWRPVLVGELLMKNLSPDRLERSPWRRGLVRHLQRHPRPVSFVSGACLMIRREVFDALGGFDEEFELYFEDADLCARSRERGWRVDFVPEATVAHRLGQSMKKNRDLASLVYRQSQIRYYRKHASPLAVSLLKMFLLVKAWRAQRTGKPSCDFLSVIHEKRKIFLTDVVAP